MPRQPRRRRTAVTASVVTALAVALGLAFVPRADAPSGLDAHDLTRAAQMSDPRSPEGGAPEAAPQDVPPWRVARPVTLVEKPARPKTRSKPKPALPAQASFVIGTFNVLGSSHTAGSGDKMASGRVRIRQAADLLAHHDVDVVGLQELQGDQYRELQRVTGGSYAFWPGTAAGPLGIENSLAWRTSTWSAVQTDTVSIPYFDGNRRPMPVVLLKHHDTGRLAWFANFHNPATNSKRGNNDRWRAMAMNIEIDLANRLQRESGYPVFITGDMNEREEYFCAMTARAPMVAANGGSNEGRCAPPPYPMPVDWIFGSDHVTFTGYLKDDSAYVRRTSDHPIVVARVLLDGTDGVLR